MFWTIELDDETTKLCIFTTPAGKHRYKTMSFRLTVCGDIFQKCMDDVIRNTSGGVIGITNHLIIFRKDYRYDDVALQGLMVASAYHATGSCCDECVISDIPQSNSIAWLDRKMGCSRTRCSVMKFAENHLQETNRSCIVYLGLSVPYLHAPIPTCDTRLT